MTASARAPASSAVTPKTNRSGVPVPPPQLGLRAGPEDPAFRFRDGDIVDAGLTAAHVAVLIEFPQLIAVGAPPLARRVVRLVLEAHRDPVPGERPQVL